MKYKEYKGDKRDVMNDSIEVEVINKIKEIIGKDFEVDIKDQNELIKFIKNPGDYIENEEIVKEIMELNALIDIMGDAYNA